MVACDLWLQEVADDGVQSYVRAVQEIKQGRLVERSACTIKKDALLSHQLPYVSGCLSPQELHLIKATLTKESTD